MSEMHRSSVPVQEIARVRAIHAALDEAVAVCQYPEVVAVWIENTNPESGYWEPRYEFSGGGSVYTLRGVRELIESGQLDHWARGRSGAIRFDMSEIRKWPRTKEALLTELRADPKNTLAMLWSDGTPTGCWDSHAGHPEYDDAIRRGLVVYREMLEPTPVLTAADHDQKHGLPAGTHVPDDMPRACEACGDPRAALMAPLVFLDPRGSESYRCCASAECRYQLRLRFSTRDIAGFGVVGEGPRVGDPGLGQLCADGHEWDYLADVCRRCKVTAREVAAAEAFSVAIYGRPESYDADKYAGLTARQTPRGDRVAKLRAALDQHYVNPYLESFPASGRNPR